MVDPVVKPENAKIKRPPKLNVLAVFRIGVTGFEPAASWSRRAIEAIFCLFTRVLRDSRPDPGLLFPCFRQSSTRFKHYAALVPGFFFLNMVRHVVRVSAIFLQSENADTGYVPLSG